MTRRFKASPHVCSRNNNDGSVILNVEKGLLYSLIGVGSLTWTYLTDSPDGLTLDEIVCSIQANFSEVPPHQIRSDVENMLNQLAEKEIVVMSHRDTERRSNGSRTWIKTSFELLVRKAIDLLLALRLKTLAAFLGLATIDLTLNLWGFRALYQTVKTWPVSDKSHAPETEREICDALEKATTWYPKQAMCLQRSAMTVCLLRQCGVLAEMVIGCRKIPFKAHAWVEVNGQVMNDKAQVQEFYGVLARC